MTDRNDSTPDYNEAGLARIRSFVEDITGGRIVRMERAGALAARLVCGC